MRLTFSLLFGLILLGGCLKPECPDPYVNGNSKDSGNVLKISFQPGSDGIDACVSDYYPDGNMGNREKILGFSWTFSGIPALYRTYFNFDFSGIPAGKTIVSAKLYLYSDTTDEFGPPEPLEHSTYSGSNDFSIRRVTSAWDEQTLTWNNQPTYDDVNKVSLPASTSYDQAYVIDMTKLVKDQIAYPNQYYGFMLDLNDHTPDRRVSFYSSDNIYPQLLPKLEIEFQ